MITCFIIPPELVMTLRNSRFPPQRTETPPAITTAANRGRVGNHLLPGLVGGGKHGRRKQELLVSLAESQLPFHGVQCVRGNIRNCCEDQPAPEET